MKKMRKGFTLVELLIVIAIIGALSATMSVAVSGSTAKAKAAAIVSNVESCKSAVVMYLNGGNDDEDDTSSVTLDDVLTEMVPTWVDFKDTDNKTVYAVDSNSTEDSSTWAITINFENEPDKETIRKELRKIKGYSKYYDGSATQDLLGDGVYKFKVTLLSGKIEPSS